MPRYPAAIEQLLLTLWAGSLWAIGYLAVPVLFHMVEDRHLAGELAGQMFRAVAVIGLACGLLLLVGRLGADGRAVWRQWRIGVLLAMLLLVACGLFLLQPQLAAIKAQPDWSQQAALAAQFRRLHGVSSILYMLTSIGALVLVMAGVRPRGGQDADRS